MDPQKILAKAEAWKRKSHRLSLTLRLRSLSEAKKFLREHSVVLWNDKGDIANLLDATIGRIANGRERGKGKAAENCAQLRKQVLQDPEFLDCRFFCAQETALHEDLWPSATVLSRANYARLKDSTKISRDAKRILAFLEKDGPTEVGRLKEVLKLSGNSETRAFNHAKLELQNQLLVIQSLQNSAKEPVQLQLWEHRMPKPVRSTADQLSEKEASLQLIAASLECSVLSHEKNIPRWFPWPKEDAQQLIDSLIEKKRFVRIIHRNHPYIILKKIL
jgi:hypothetical protein